jgi:wyosine [tRNA(Phe)-imidazoG37] synthetase (radical SAM superfamily)
MITPPTPRVWCSEGCPYCKAERERLKAKEKNNHG